MNRLAPTDRSLPFALLRARERVMGPIRAMLGNSGVTEQQWRILRVLDDAGPLSAAEVADRASLSAPSLSRIAHGMETRGLITRTEVAGDRRRQNMILTDAGRAVIARHMDEALRIAEEYRRDLGDDYEELLRILSRLG